jgi:hypothetical protein
MQSTEHGGNATARHATADEDAGMKWWNSLSEIARRFWLNQADTAVVADAWKAYKSRPVLTPSPPQRTFSGMRFEGKDLSVHFNAVVTGCLSVTVDASPAVTGFREWCRLGDGERSLHFSQDGISVNGNTLECFARCSAAPLYSEGFRVEVEPHMAEQIIQWLPPLARTAVLAKAMAITLKGQLPENTPVAHMHSFTSDVAAHVVLDEQSPEDAVNAVCEEHWAAREERFVATFRSGELLQLMQDHYDKRRH